MTIPRFTIADDVDGDWSVIDHETGTFIPYWDRRSAETAAAILEREPVLLERVRAYPLEALALRYYAVTADSGEVVVIDRRERVGYCYDEGAPVDELLVHFREVNGFASNWMPESEAVLRGYGVRIS